MCSGSRNVAAVVNSSFEFNCSTECTSDISWRYMSLSSSANQPDSLSLPACLEHKRCETKENSETGASLLSIDRVQLGDAGTYLCSAGTGHIDYCEMSFNFSGNFQVPAHARYT